MDSKYTKAAQIAAVVTPFIAAFAAKYGISNEVVVNVITGVCMVGLALAPSVMAIFKK